MTTADALARMRCTSALLAVAPSLSARLVHDDVIIVEVMRPPFPVREHAVLPPCWFRGLVAEGVQGGLELGSLAHGRIERLAACRIDLGMRDGTTLMPGEVVRLEADRRWVHLHAVPAPVEQVGEVVPAAASDLPAAAGQRPVELRAVDDLDVTLLAQATPKTAAASAAAAELLRTVAIRVAIARLEAELASIADHPPRSRRHEGDGGR